MIWSFSINLFQWILKSQLNYVLLLFSTRLDSIPFIYYCIHDRLCLHFLFNYLFILFPFFFCWAAVKLCPSVLVRARLALFFCFLGPDLSFLEPFVSFAKCRRNTREHHHRPTHLHIRCFQLDFLITTKSTLTCFKVC